MTNEETVKEIAQLLHTAADAICHAADQLNRMAKKENGSEVHAPSNKQTPQLTLEEVRRVAADKARQGFTEEVRSLIHRDRICTVAIEVVNLFWTRRGYFWNNPSTLVAHTSNLGKQDTVHIL